ncbi:MAG: 50S ribosomal protein L6 [Candidatus Gygaella obscura]|nr:50S ribosomal protein L6 [Candidatus Gygaella obscura]
MSRIGQKTIDVAKDLKLNIKDSHLELQGAKGKLFLDIPEGIKVDFKDDKITVTRISDIKKHKALHGLVRSLIANMVEGVSKGFSKQLEIQGVGFRAQMEDKILVMQLGFSHPVRIEATEGIKVEVQRSNITVSGIDKALVGQVAANIRAVYPPEPYKGKGIRYVGEVVRKKLGKAATATGGK